MKKIIRSHMNRAALLADHLAGVGYATHGIDPEGYGLSKDLSKASFVRNSSVTYFLRGYS